MDAGTPGGAESGPGASGSDSSAGGAGGGAAGRRFSWWRGGLRRKSGGSGSGKTQQLKNVLDTGTASGAKINQAVEGDDGEATT